MAGADPLQNIYVQQPSTTHYVLPTMFYQGRIERRGHESTNAIIKIAYLSHHARGHG